MAETHELRLKINAAAARAGAREFVSAIRTIQSAVEGLDRASEASFGRIYEKAKNTGTSMKTLATQYGAARTANDRFTESVKRANSALQRQISLASQMKGAGGGVSSGSSSTSARAGDQQISMQNRVKRAVDDTRLSVERLTTSLMKVGGFQSINDVSAAYRRFQKEVSGAVVSAQQLDSAKTRLNSSLKSAQTSLVTLTAKAQDNARAEKEAAAAARQRASATATVTAATNAAAAAQAASNSAAERTARAQLTAAQAMRQAEQEAARLRNRLSDLGDTRGITAIDQALIRLRSSMSNISGSSLKARQAMSQFLSTTNQVKVGLTQAEGAQKRAASSAREMAGAHRDGATAARRVERELRSIAGAGNAASKSMRDATGSMRGLENAFSGTFQIGSAFRTLLGSITFGTFIQGVYGAGAALNQFRTTMEVATGSVSGAMEQMDFIDGMTSELGTNLRTAREDFAKFAVAANLAGVETDTARGIFQSVSQAMTVMGRGTEDQRLAFLALEQMLSKNTISSEELRRQLGERLPGAVSLMAKAVGVTTAELQDLLKAGTLVSSEVLPKFAEEVDKAFGPGLERALTRAPAALGRFRNEIEFFLSSVADSGLMDELASSFDSLTDAMRNPESREAAEALGQGLADLAAISTDFAVGFIENIDTVGAVAKAVIGGVIVRQVILMGNALLTGATRSTAAFSQLTTSMTANTTAMTAHTAALTRVAAGNTAVAASQVRTTATTTAQTAATVRLNAAMATAPATAGRAAAAIATMGRVAGTAAAGMAVASRVLVGLAGPIGLAVTALSLLPLMFNDAGESAVDMADDVDSAVRRAGTSLDQLASRDYTAASVTALGGLTADINVLQAQLDRAAGSQDRFAAGFNSMSRVMSNFTREAEQSSIFVQQQNRALSAVGMTRDALQGLGETSQYVIRQTMDVGEAAARGETSWIAYYRAIQRAIDIDPDSAGVLERLQEEARAHAEAELAVAAHREQLTLLFGTEDDKSVTRFTQMALAALRAGEGFEALRTQIEETGAQAPELAARYQAVLDEISRSFAAGDTIPEIRLGLGDDLGESADEIIRLRGEMESTARFAANMQASFSEGVGAFMNRFSAEGVGSEGLAEIRAVLEDFAQFENATLPLENLKLILSEMNFPTEDAQLFADAVQRQFATLAPAEQTYDRFRQIVGQLAQEFDSAGTSVGPFSQELANTVRSTTEASRTSEDLRSRLSALLQEYGMTADAAANATQWLYSSADGATAAGREATIAEGGMVAAANGLDHVANASAQAAAQVRGVVAALAALGAAGAAVPAAAAGIASDIRFQASQRSRPIYERAAASFVREQQETISEAYTAAEGEARAMGVDSGIFLAAARADRDAAMQAVEEGAADIEAASLDLYNTEQWQDPNRRTGSGGSRGGNRKATGGSGGRGGSSTDSAATAAERLDKAIKSLSESLTENLTSLEAENNSLMLLTSGYTTSERAARLLGEAQAAGVNIFDEQTAGMLRQIEAAEKLNEALTRLANDPVNDWMNSVPTWREAGQQIETGVFNHLSDAISNFIQTGEFSFEALGEAILGTVADIIADKAVKELANLLGGNTSGSGEGGFGLGGMLSNLFGNGGSRGDDPDPFASGFGGGGDQSASMQNAMVQGGQQAAQAIQQAMMQAGQQVGQQITTGGQTAASSMQTGVTTAGTAAGTQMSTQTMTGGTIAGTQMMTQTQTGGTIAAQQMQQGIMQGGAAAAQQMAAASAGGGGGGGFMGGGLGGILLGAGIGLLSSVLGKKSSSSSTADDEPETPVGIRQYAEGTANTSGIPAILHPNEAVIPLSGGRKVPVEMNDDAASGSGGSKTVVQNFNITTPDADSFRKSQKQIAADAASSGRKAMADNG